MVSRGRWSSAQVGVYFTVINKITRLNQEKLNQTESVRHSMLSKKISPNSNKITGIHFGNK